MNRQDDDALDGVLFRFWTRAASEFPGETMAAIMHCTNLTEYRSALLALAIRKGVNLPEPEDVT